MSELLLFFWLQAASKDSAADTGNIVRAQVCKGEPWRVLSLSNGMNAHVLQTLLCFSVVDVSCVWNYAFQVVRTITERNMVRAEVLSSFSHKSWWSDDEKTDIFDAIILPLLVNNFYDIPMCGVAFVLRSFFFWQPVLFKRRCEE